MSFQIPGRGGNPAWVRMSVFPVISTQERLAWAGTARSVMVNEKAERALSS